MTQGTLIRKLCTYTAPNPTRRAIFEFDKLTRSIYTLRYLRDPQLERNVHGVDVLQGDTRKEKGRRYRRPPIALSGLWR
jgi:hypothetical protein